MIMGIRVDFVKSESPYDISSLEREEVRKKLRLVIASLKDKSTICIARASISTEIDFIYACIDEEVPFYIYIPFDNIEKKWPPIIQLAYKAVLKKAKGKLKTGNGTYSPKKISKAQTVIDTRSECLIIVGKDSNKILKIEAHIK